MNDIEATLQKMRSNYHQLRYPGNLARDVLPDDRRRPVRWISAPPTVAAATIVIMVLVGLLMLLPRPETQTSIVSHGEPALITAGAIAMNLDMSGINLVMTKPDMAELALTGDMAAGTLPALGSLSLYELVRRDMRQFHSTGSPEDDN